jgi:hypothetical protein
VRGPQRFVVDLTHFLASDGSIEPQRGPARRLADYFTKIVVAATATTPELNSNMIRCRRRPGRKPCVGEIETDIDTETGQIVWWCPACGEEGTISHWKGSLWDCSNSAPSH